MKRVYHNVLEEHFDQNRQMAFLTGPRQVGKTTVALRENELGNPLYLNWDNKEDRLLITGNTEALLTRLDSYALSPRKPHVVFDEIHKYSRWKQFLKGFFDVHGERFHISVTGSARLNVYKKGGDSLMGRYFLYRMHPISVGEVLDTSISERVIRPPKNCSPDLLDSLMQFGGFPEPFIKANTRFYNRWRRLRNDQLFREDVRDTTNIHELAQLEIMAELLSHQSGSLLNYSTLANQVGISVDTVRRWLSTLESMYFCFRLRPYFNNVPKSLRKQPKVFMWDWSLVQDKGARVENMVASHLLKAVHFWTDAGFGTFDVFYLRDTAKREVDFLVTRDTKPWFLVEAKSGTSKSISKSLTYFHNLLQTEHAFQVQLDAPYVERDCFNEKHPVKVPASTLLSQLI